MGEMDALDVVEIWWVSVRHLLEYRGVTGSFHRSPTDRSKPSCSLNLRRGEAEIDLMVWTSGEAELAIKERFGDPPEQQHFADAREPIVLAALLKRAAALAGPGSNAA